MLLAYLWFRCDCVLCDHSTSSNCMSTRLPCLYWYLLVPVCVGECLTWPTNYISDLDDLITS